MTPVHRPLVLLSLLLCLLLVCCRRQDRPHGENADPNVVVIMADDLGYGDVSAPPFGGWIDTPHLTRMAEEGMRLTDFHAGGPVCSPTRASLLTARYQQRAGIPGVIYAARDANRHHGLHETEFTFAELAKKAGYATGMFGKWHLGYRKQYNPRHHGFDQFRGYVSGNVDYISHVDGIGVHDWWRDTTRIEEEGYTTHLINEHATQFIENHREEPFCLYIAHEAPHWPYQAPDDSPIRQAGGEKTRTPPRATDDTAYVRSRYRRMVKVMDEGVGRVLSTLKRLDLAENTLVLFFSDNGPRKPYGAAGPLRGWKGSLLEGGHRVPAFAWWPGHVDPGSQSSALTSTLDVLPTIGDLLGADPPAGHTIDGRSLLPVLLENASFENRQMFWAYRDQQAMREGPWKLVRNVVNANVDQTIEEERALFRLDEDLGERDNLADQYPDRVERMTEALEAWNEEVTTGATEQPTKK